MTLLSHLRRVAAVGSIETLGVVVAGVAGLLIVNVLPKELYAQYTFLIACMTLTLGVTDLGLAHCCLPIVGTRAHEVPWVMGACQRVFHWRWALLTAGLLVVVPYWAYNSGKHGWWGGGYLLASLLVIGLVLCTLREHFASTVLLILGLVPTLNRIALTSTPLRLALIGLVLLLPVGGYSVAGLIAGTMAASVASLWLYRRAFARHGLAEHPLGIDDARRVDHEALRISRPLVLPAIFYQVQGVITVLLASLFGNANMLAEVGAIGRLAMVLTVADRVTSVLLFPAIARAPAGPRLAAAVARVHLAYVGAMALVFLSALWLPQYWILLLGAQYKSMTAVVWMMFLASLLNNVAGLTFRTLTVRGITARQSYSIPVVLGTQVLYLWLFGVADLRSVLGFNLATSAVNCGYQYILLVLHRQRLRTG